MYNNQQQLSRFEDDMFDLALLGLMELEGLRLIAENKHLKNKGQHQTPSATEIRKIESMIRRGERKSKIRQAAKWTAPVITKVAVLFLVLSLGTSTVLFASADAREALYQLIVERHERYTQIDPNGQAAAGIAEAEPYLSAGFSHIPGYIPPEVTLQDIEHTRYSENASYTAPNDSSLYLLYRQISPTGQAAMRMDTEDADQVRNIDIGSSEGLLIVKDGSTQIVWQVEGLTLLVSTNLGSEEAISFARGITPVR